MGPVERYGIDWIEFVPQAANPGVIAANTLYQDDGTNFDTGTLVWGSPAAMAADFSVGPVGNEQGGILVQGVNFDAIAKINQLGGPNQGMLIMHRHSDTFASNLAFSRSRGETAAHVAVQPGDVLSQVSHLGWSGTHYDIAAFVNVIIPPGGTVNSGSLPGQFDFYTTPDGSDTALLAMSILEDQSVLFANGASGVDHGALTGLADDDHVNYFFALGRAGGQFMIGGTNPADGITMQSNTTNTGAGRINMLTPVEFGAYSSSTAVYGFNYEATESFTGAFIGGGLNFSGTIGFSAATFIYESFRGAPTITSGVNPGFAAYTVLQALPVLNAGPGAGNNPLAPLIVNAGGTIQNTFAGTRTTSAYAGMNIAGQVKATLSGAVMNVTAFNGIIFAPKYSTVAGSTINFGTVRGLHGQNIINGLFQPSAGAELITRYALVDCNDITFGGTSERAVVRSEMTAGTGKYFLLNTANALSSFGDGYIKFNDGVGIQFGDTTDIIYRYFAGQAAMEWNSAFGVAGNSLYLRPSGTDTWTFQQDNGGANDIGLGFNCNAISFGVVDPVPNSNNWFVMFAGPNQRAVQINGEYSDVLWTASGSINVDGNTVSDLQAFKINSPSILLNGGTIANMSNLFVSAMPSFGAPLRQALRVTGRATIDGVMNSGSNVQAQITANQNDYQLGQNNNQRTMNLLDSDAAYNITGIDSADSFAQIGDRICLYNEGAFALTLTHQDAASAAANRIITPTGVGYVIGPDECVWLWYDDTGTARWRMLEGTGA
jgi:hypothetical protein